jgi:hypothetical protein
VSANAERQLRAPGRIVASEPHEAAILTLIDDRVQREGLDIALLSYPIEDIVDIGSADLELSRCPAITGSCPK